MTIIRNPDTILVLTLKQEIEMNEQDECEVSYSIPIVCIVAILVLTFMMVISK